MSNRLKKIEKKYLSIPFEIEDGLSTYDLQLLSLGKKYKVMNTIKAKSTNEYLAA